jgi:hypothetical protein
MSSDLVFGHRCFSVLLFDKLPLWRQAHSFFKADHFIIRHRGLKHTEPDG